MRLLSAGLLLCALSLPGHAKQVAPPDDRPVQTLDTVLVSGARSGPGMWQVRHGDHVLWILGTQSPLPKRLEWSSEQVAATLAQSQEVLRLPGVKFDAGVGMLRGMFLLPSLFAARKNPDDQRLEDVLPQELLARWRVLKAKYMPRKNKVERWRPIFAAGELYEQAIDASGMTMKDKVWPTLAKIAKKNDVPITESNVEVEIDAPRDAIKEFTATGLDDTACFAKTLERLETDLGAMKARANAWADGHLEALRALPFVDQNAACREAVLRATVSESRGLSDLPERVKALWVQNADAALQRNVSTFAVLPIARILAPDGYLVAFREKGYEIVEPD